MSKWADFLLNKAMNDVLSEDIRGAGDDFELEIKNHQNTVNLVRTYFNDK